MKKNFIFISVISYGMVILLFLHLILIFPEYFISIGIFSILIVFSIVKCNLYGLMVQKIILESIALILFIVCYLLVGENLIITIDSTPFSNLYMTPQVSYMVASTIAIFSTLYFFFIWTALNRETLNGLQVFLIILFSWLGLFLVYSSDNLLTVCLSLEFIFLSLHICLSFQRITEYNIFLSIIFSIFFLFCSSFLFEFLDCVNFNDLRMLYEQLFLFHSGEPNCTPIKILFLFFLKDQINKRK